MFYLVIVVTNKQTDRQTNAGDSIIARFRRDNNKQGVSIQPFTLCDAAKRILAS